MNGRKRRYSKTSGFWLPETIACLRGAPKHRFCVAATPGPEAAPPPHPKLFDSVGDVGDEAELDGA